jgi:hypothetical protein
MLHNGQTATMFQHPKNNFLDTALRNRYLDLAQILIIANFHNVSFLFDKIMQHRGIKPHHIYILYIYAVIKRLASPC